MTLVCSVGLGLLILHPQCQSANSSRQLIMCAGRNIARNLSGTSGSELRDAWEQFQPAGPGEWFARLDAQRFISARENLFPRAHGQNKINAA